MSKILFTKDHEYIAVDGDIGTVGITDFAQGQLGDVVFVELPEIGKLTLPGEQAGVVESVRPPAMSMPRFPEKSSKSTALWRKIPLWSTRTRKARAGSTR
jgi:hypothetical protein